MSKHNKRLIVFLLAILFVAVLIWVMYVWLLDINDAVEEGRLGCDAECPSVCLGLEA
ncbi:hypothetical protein ACFL1G_11880 [Planctomycetota bacterium]